MKSYISTLSSDCTALALPSEIPVMVLSECFLFPGCLLPLFIFEERYRLMLEHALASHRMFCIGTRTDDGGVLPVSTAGVVRGCVRHEDGTSHLVLMGTRRIRFLEWVNGEPYRKARIEPVQPDACDAEEVKRLRAAVMSLLPPCPEEAQDVINPLCEKLRSSADCEFVCDVLTYHFVQEPVLLAASLLETNLARRYRLLLDVLSRAS